VTLAGVAVDEPDVRDTYQNLRLRAETLTAGQGVPALRTDELGTVEFVTDGERLWVQGTNGSALSIASEISST
jgi:hypothetical protein